MHFFFSFFSRLRQSLTQKKRFHPFARSQEFRLPSRDDHSLVLSITKKQTLPKWQQLRWINHLLSSRERQIFWLCLSVAIISVLIGLTSLTMPLFVRVPAIGGTLTEALIGTPKRINPLFAPLQDVDRDLSSLIYSGLFRLNENGEPIPDLAESYRWMDGKKTLEITLLPNIRFHDDAILTSQDVVFTYQAVKNPNWRSPLLPIYRQVQITARDARTLQFQTITPHPWLLYDLTLGILPAHIWENVSDIHANLADANIKPIGSGPYQAVSFKRDENGAIFLYHFKRFISYYGQKPSILFRDFRFFEDRDQAIQAVKNNQVDALAFAPWKEIQRIDIPSTMKTIAIDLPHETVAFFRLNDPVLKDENVRESLRRALDPSDFLQVQPHSSLLASPYPFLTATSTRFNSIIGPIDIMTSRSLLNKAGWVLKEGETIRTQRTTTAKKKKNAKTEEPSASSTKLTFMIDVPQQPDILEIAEILKRRWSVLGIEVTIRSNADTKSLLKRVRDEQDYQILLLNILLPATQDLAPYWNGIPTEIRRGYNFSGYHNQKLDAIFEQLQNASTTESVAHIRSKISNIVVEDMPALFLLRPSYAYIVSNTVLGVRRMKLGVPSDRFAASRDWYLKTRLGWK